MRSLNVNFNILIVARAVRMLHSLVKTKTPPHQCSSIVKQKQQLSWIDCYVLAENIQPQVNIIVKHEFVVKIKIKSHIAFGPFTKYMTYTMAKRLQIFKKKNVNEIKIKI